MNLITIDSMEPCCQTSMRIPWNLDWQLDRPEFVTRRLAETGGSAWRCGAATGTLPRLVLVMDTVPEEMRAALRKGAGTDYAAGGADSIGALPAQSPERPGVILP